jgi:arylsulfatase A-like enzyme
LDGQIVDIAPTVLAYLGIAVPRHMDGKVLDGFSQPLGAHYEDVDRSGTASTDYTDEEQAAVERNLTDLGYL